MRGWRTIAGVLLLVAGGLGCAGLGNMVQKMKPQAPQVSVADVKLNSLSFSGAELGFVLDVKNPNPVGVSLAGFDYDFLVEGASLLSGKKEEKLQIPSRGEEKVELPVRLTFRDVFSAIKSLANQDSFSYELRSHLRFDLPVVGRVSVPVKKSGALPVLQLPAISLEGLKVKNLSFSGLDAVLKVKVKNPSGISLLLQKLDYSLAVAGKNWIQSALAGGGSQQKIPPKGSNVLEIPLHLNLMSIGTSLYSALKNGESLPYSFRGKIDLATSLPLVKPVEMPFQLEGKLPVVR